MSDTAQILVAHMVAAEGWPEPQLLEDILAQGEAAVPPLLEVVRREVTDWLEVETRSAACNHFSALDAASPLGMPK